MIKIKKIKEILDYYFNIICLGLIIFLLTGVVVLIYRSFNTTQIKKEEVKQIAVSKEVNEITDNLDLIKVDIKGAIKKPGVYEMNKGNNVLDIINKAGGLTKNATTSNINLSRTLEDQMVIKIFTKSELKKQSVSIENTISECVCENTIINDCIEKDSSIIKIDGENINLNENNNSIENNKVDNNANKLVSINTASKEELMTLNSIGEAKANAIIEYRNNNGKFKSIEDVKNVSGIGDALFEKIKDNITI